jgi:hypothetical protein
VTADTVIPDQFSTQSWNRFSYCRNNPIIYRDPTGHAEEESYSAKLSPLGEMGAAAGSLIDSGLSLFNKAKDTSQQACNSVKNAVTEKLNKANDSANKFISNKKQEYINDIIGTQDIKKYARESLKTSTESDGRPLPVQPQPSLFGRGYKATTGVEGSIAANVLGFGEKSPFMVTLDRSALHSTSVVHDNYVKNNKLGMSDRDFWTSMPKSFVVAKEVEKINRPYREADLNKYREKEKFNESVKNTTTLNR